MPCPVMAGALYQRQEPGTCGQALCTVAGSLTPFISGGPFDAPVDMAPVQPFHWHKAPHSLNGTGLQASLQEQGTKPIASSQSA